MSQIVQLPDGGTAEFPDEASVDQIKSTLAKYHKPSPTPETDRAAADTATLASPKTSSFFSAKTGVYPTGSAIPGATAEAPLTPETPLIPAQANPLYWVGRGASSLGKQIGGGYGNALQFEGGLAQGAAEAASGFSTAPNLLMTGLIPEGKLAQGIVSTVFLGQAIAGTPEQIAGIKQAYANGDWTNVARGLASLSVGYAAPALGAFHAIARRSPIKGGEPDASGITSTTGVPQPEVRTQLGEETPLRQQGEAAQVQTETQKGGADQRVLARNKFIEEAVPAIRLSPESEPIRGEPFQTHNDIIGDQPNATEIMASDPERGFLHGDEFLTREQAAERVGEKEPLQSERLHQLKRDLEQLRIQGGETIDETQKESLPQQQATDEGGKPSGLQSDTGQSAGASGGQIPNQIRPGEQGNEAGVKLGGPVNDVLKPGERAAGEVKTPAISSLPTSGIKGNIYNAINNVRDRVSKAITRSQATAGYFAGMEKGSKIGAQAAKTEATDTFNQAMRWHEADTNAVRESLLDAVKQLPADQQGRFTSRITKVLNQPFDVRGGRKIKGEFVSNTERMWRAAGKVGDQIKRAADESERKGIISEIQSTFEKASASPTVDVGYKNLIKNIFDAIQFKKPSAKTMQELLSRQEYVSRMEAQGKPHGLPAYAIDELVRLKQVPISTMPIEQLSVLRDKLNTLVEQGRLKRATKQSLWQGERDGLISKLQRSLANKFARKEKIVPEAIAVENDRSGRLLRNKITTIQNAASFIGQGLLPRDAAFEWADGSTGNYDGFLVTEFGGRIDLAFNDMSTEWSEMSKRVSDAFKKGGIKPDGNQNGRIAVFANLQMEGGKERMLESGSATPETIESVEKSGLTPAEMKAYQEMMATKEALFPDVQKVMADLYNIDVKKVDNHWSWYRDWDRFEAERPHQQTRDPVSGEVYDEHSAIDEFLFGYDPKYRTTSVEKGITKQRVPDAKTPITLDAHGTWEKMAKTMLFIKHMQPELKMLGEVARQPEFKAKYGDMMQKYSLDWLDTVSRAGRGVNMIPMLDALRKNVSAGIIGGRLGSQMKHIAFVPYAMYHSGGAKWYVRGLAAAHTPEGQAFISKNFGEITQRQSSHIGVAELGDKGVRALAKKVLFFPVRSIDAENASATALGRYMYELESRGLDWKNFDTLPVDQSSRAQSLVRMRRAVASPIYKDVPLALSRGYGLSGSTSIARSVFQFGNPKLDQWSNVRVDLIGAAKRGEYGKAAKIGSAITMGSALEAGVVVGYNALRALAIGGLFGLFFGNKKEQYKVKEDYASDYVKDFASDLIFKLPLTSNAWSMIQYGESSIPLVDVMVKGGQHAKQAITGQGIPHVTQEGERKPTQLKPETRLKAGFRAAGELGSLTGIPGISQAADLATGVVPRPQRTTRARTRNAVGSFGGQTQRKAHVAGFR